MENSFIQSLGRLEEPVRPSLFDRNILAALQAANLDEPQYCFGQALEPSILKEVSYFTGLSEEQLSLLQHSGSALFDKVKWLFENKEYLHNWNSITFAAVLASIARYEAAEEVISQVIVEDLPPSWELLYYQYRFLIANRLDQDYSTYLKKLSSFSEDSRIEESSRLEIISQMIVWNEKNRRTFQQDLAKLRSTESDLVEKLKGKKTFHAMASLSAYYRAKAMEPKDPQQVRSIMDLCLQSTEMLSPKTEIQDIVKTQLMKTYFESSIKEGIYVRKDLSFALESAESLVQLDPLWSISWQEKAEVEFRMNNLESALDSMVKAVELGSPRVPHHLYGLSQVAQQIGDLDLQYSSLQRLSLMDPDNEEVQQELFQLKKEFAHA